MFYMLFSFQIRSIQPANFTRHTMIVPKETGSQDIKITQSHGGSDSRARSVIEGNEVDVVTFAFAYDVAAIDETGLIESGWLGEFDLDSSPYTSTIVFLMRKGNEKAYRTGMT